MDSLKKASVYLMAVMSTAFLILYLHNVPATNNSRLNHARLRIIVNMNHYQGVKEKWTIITDEHGNNKCWLKDGGADPSEGDLAVFRELNIAGYPPKNNPQQLWAFFGQEAQIKIPQTVVQKNWDGLFNYSVTFQRNNQGKSHLFIPKVTRIFPPTIHYFKPKPRMKALRALWFVSHCKESLKKTKRIYSGREEYVLELSKYITITIFSLPARKDCFKAFGNLTQSSRMAEKNVKMEDYMFYLAFENNLCQDYITEKLWKVLESNSTTIPIVLGGLSMENYEHVAPPNSFIHVKNFTSPEALANHLKFVAQDDNAFHYYNQWRNEFLLNSINPIPRVHLLPNQTGPYGYFCKLAYERPHRVWYNFSKEHNKNQCIDVSQPAAYCSYYNMSCNH